LLPVRVMFWSYWLVLVTVLVTFAVVGLGHH
jgi:hypothetical protein